ncbi:MAG: tRNA guanosine(34) transglycosylase Tgt [Chloroflexota bacterium]
MLGVGALQPSTYAFLVRPGLEHVRRGGGLRAYLNWPGPVLTDSGGVLPTESWGRPGTPAPRIIRVDDDGMTVNSYLDGSTVRITPESSIAAQIALGSRVLTALVSPSAARRGGGQRQREWAMRALAVRRETEQTLLLHAVDAEDVELMHQLHFDGLSSDDLAAFEALGRPDRTGSAEAPAQREGPTAASPWLRVWTGSGGPDDVVRAIRAGVDLISGSAAIERAGKGRAWTAEGELNLTDATFEQDAAPVESGCACPTCADGFARGYVRHLFSAEELLGPTLLTMHNVHVLTTLVLRMRAELRV